MNDLSYLLSPRASFVDGTTQKRKTCFTAHVHFIHWTNYQIWSKFPSSDRRYYASYSRFLIQTWRSFQFSMPDCFKWPRGHRCWKVKNHSERLGPNSSFQSEIAWWQCHALEAVFHHHHHHTWPTDLEHIAVNVRLDHQAFCTRCPLFSLLILAHFHPPPQTHTTHSEEDAPLGLWASNCLCSCEETCEVLQTVVLKCQLKTGILLP